MHLKSYLGWAATFDALRFDLFGIVLRIVPAKAGLFLNKISLSKGQHKSRKMRTLTLPRSLIKYDLREHIQLDPPTILRFKMLTLSQHVESALWLVVSNIWRTKAMSKQQRLHWTVPESGTG